VKERELFDLEAVKSKKNLIRERDKDGSLIFKPPSDDTLYTISELKAILENIIGVEIPQEKTIVQRKHWITYKTLESLGYRRPSGLRTKEAKANKPKFRNQLMDIFVQKHSNLQVWNYIPYACERYGCRYVIFKVNDEKILGLLIKTGEELKDWDLTGTRTIKWQAIITDTTRKKAMNNVLVSEKDPVFSKFNLDKRDLEPLQNRINKIKETQKNERFLLKREPNPKLLVTIDELEGLLAPLLDTVIEYTSEKLLGQNFQASVAKQLGYSIEKGFSINSGQIPDMIHQVIETKVQISPTIDLGYHLPIDNDPLTFDWNKNKITPRDIRYVIALADRMKDNKAQVKGIVITSGEEFEEFFSFCEGTNFKVQMTIPNFDSI